MFFFSQNSQIFVPVLDNTDKQLETTPVNGNRKNPSDSHDQDQILVAVPNSTNKQLETNPINDKRYICRFFSDTESDICQADNPGQVLVPDSDDEKNPSGNPNSDDEKNPSGNPNSVARDINNKKNYVSLVRKSELSKTGKLKKTNRVYNSKHPCPFCKKIVSNFSHHIFSKKHEQEELIIKIRRAEKKRT